MKQRYILTSLSFILFFCCVVFSTHPLNVIGDAHAGLSAQPVVSEPVMSEPLISETIISDAIVSEQQATNAVFNRIEQHDKTIVVNNRNHRVIFDKNGVNFAPTQGPNWHWQIKHTKSVAPIVNKRMVEYIHPQYTERYLLKAQTIEQRFIIEKPYRAKHDLIIEGSINSAGQFSTTSTGWRWQNTEGGVNLGQVTVFDAKGNILPATMHTSARHRNITIAASDLHGAHYPVTIDPEIGSNDFRISEKALDTLDFDVSYNSTDITYNVTTNEFFIVWSARQTMTGEREIYGQRVNATTSAIIGSDVRLSDMGPDGDTNYDAFFHAAAYNSQNNEYFVVWVGDDDTRSLVDGEAEIFGQRVNAVTAEEIGVDVRYSDMGPDGDTSYGADTPDVSYNENRNEYLIVWQGDDTGALVNGEFEIYSQRINASDGSEIGLDKRLSDMGPDGNTGFQAATPALSFNANNNV